jgi:hypothetical protein
MSSSSASGLVSLPEYEQFATKHQYMAFAEDEHPFRSWQLCHSIEDSYQLELFLPRKYFSINATKWVHFTPDMDVIARNVLDLLLLFSYIVSEARAKFHGHDVEPAAKKKKGKRGMQRSDSRMSSDEAGAASPPADSENLTPEMLMQLQNTLSERDSEDRRSGVISLIEVVPGHFPQGTRVSAVRPTVGLRKRVFVNNKDRFNPAFCLFSLFQLNEQRRRNEKHKPNPFRQPGPKPRIQMIDYERYCELVQWYCVKSIPRNEMLDVKEMLNDNCPLNPMMAFNLTRSLELAAQARALEDYCDINNYLEPHPEQPGFNLPCSPHRGDSVYWLKAQHDDPSETFRYLWPHVSPTIEDDTQRRLYSNDDEDASQVDRVLRLTCAQGTHAGSVNDIHALRKRQIDRRMAVKKRQPDRNTREWGDMLHEVEQQGMEEFMQIFSRNGDVPRSIRAICRYTDSELARNGAAMPWEKTSKDLSRFGDLIASMGYYAESVAQTNTLHTDIVATLVSTFFLYLYRPFQVNTLFAGDAMIGKSYIMEILQKILIPGTWFSVASQSDKANAVHGKEMDNQIVFFEEMPPGLLGVEKGKSGHTNSGGYNDRDNIFKGSLTTGKYYHNRQVKDPETGLWKREEVAADVNNVYIAGMNLSISEIPFPMASRFHCKQMQVNTRTGGNGLLGKMQKNTNPGYQIVQDQWHRRMQRTHALIAQGGYMVYSQVLADMSLTVYDTIFPEIMREAAAAGLPDTGNSRHQQRTRAFVEVFVLLEAIDIVFDSEFALVQKDTPFDPRQLLLLKPYLRDTLDHVVLAIGMLSAQFEQPIQRNIIETLSKTTFNASIQTAKLFENNQEFAGDGGEYEPLYGYQHPQHPNYDVNYFYTTYPNVASYPSMPGGPAANGGDAVPNGTDKGRHQPRHTHAPSHHEEHALINLLASELHMKMQPKPSKQSIVAQLQRIMEQQVPDKNPANPNSLIKAMYFHDGKLFMSRLLFDKLEAANLKKITERVVSKCIKHERTFLWGQPHPDRFYAFQTLHVVPTKPKRKEALVVLDPTYVDPRVVEGTLRLVGSAADSELVRSAFSSTPGWIVDGSIERLTTKMHLVHNGITKDSMQHWPPALPSEYMKKLLDFHCMAQLPSYVEDNELPVPDARKRVLDDAENNRMSKKLRELDACELYDVEGEALESEVFQWEDDDALDTTEIDEDVLRDMQGELPMDETLQRTESSSVDMTQGMEDLDPFDMPSGQ